jgi:sugar-specific transcriptional regulator TrmB
MDVQLLEDIGLTKPQAFAYKTLVELGTGNAPAIAAEIGESRSNTYKILDRLCDLGLADRSQGDGKKSVRYLPTSPAALEQLVKKQAEQVSLRERKLNAELPSLLDFFFAHSERPSIRYFQGGEGLQQIFTDMLKTRKTIYLLRSPADVTFYDEEFFAQFRKKRALLGIKTHALTPDVPSAVHDAELDKKNLFFRTWIAADAYTGNVEWDIYGDKVALISYGEEAMGVIVESPQIADSFRQVFQLARAASATAANATEA